MSSRALLSSSLPLSSSSSSSLAGGAPPPPAPQRETELEDRDVLPPLAAARPSKSSSLSESSPAARRRLSTLTKFSTQFNQDENEENIEQKQGALVLAKLPTPGFNRIKTLWAKRESTAGFSSPLSTWSRNYAGSNRKLMGASQDDDQALSSPRLKMSDRFDPDKLATSQTYLNFGQPVDKVPRIKLERYGEEIPLVLISLRDELENSGGFNVEGVFRVGASMDDQRQIKALVDIGKYTGCKNVDDSMCVASLIKEWFRTLQPLRILNYLPVESVRAGAANVDLELCEPQLSVFLWLVDLMADVCKLEYINRMSPRAMAIVIAPNLYDAALASSPQEIIQEMNGATQIVEHALRACLAKRQLLQGDLHSVAQAIRNKEHPTPAPASLRNSAIQEE